MASNTLFHIVRQYPPADQRHVLVAQGGVFSRPTALQTVLGSCVGVTFFCPKKGVGGIFHALLPTWNDYEDDYPHANVFRYVDSGIQAIHRILQRKGVKPESVECKVFGGASAMFQGEISVGQRNAQTAFTCLEELRLRVATANVGGDRGRKLLFLTNTGEVFVKYLRRQESPA